MVIPKISNTLLRTVSQDSYRMQALREYKHKNDLDELYQEKAKLLALQESRRLLRNYNYMKDTEELRQYVFWESIKEQRLLQRNTVQGIFIDRYV